MLIKHSGGVYEIILGSVGDALARYGSDARIITDRNVAAVLADHVAIVPNFVIEPGENSKDLATFGRILEWLAQTQTSRKTHVIALGGGVVGDLAGFVAASYMRGVPFVQIPTSLLAMVDSSVGGKVGVDLAEGKNLAGAFKAPTAVHLSMSVLGALPTREFRNGMAEVLKYGFIMDKGLADRLVAKPLTQTSAQLSEIVLRCIELKAAVVEADEFETTGYRAILNYGHTIGHAIEHVLGYGTILHGEAISIGMVLEAKLGERLGISQVGTASEIQNDLASYGLPTELPEGVEIEPLLGAMYRDKKVEGGKLAFSLLEYRGRCKLIRDIDEQTVRAVIGNR